MRQRALDRRVWEQLGESESAELARQSQQRYCSDQNCIKCPTQTAGWPCPLWSTGYSTDLPPDLATYCVCWKCLPSLHKHRLPGCVLPGMRVARLCYQLFLEQLSCCFWNAGDWIQEVHTLKLSYSLIQFSFHIHFTQTETKDQKVKRQCCKESL